MDTLQALLDTSMRSLFAVIALEVLARVNGAKQISQLSFYDYVTGITIGSMAAVMAIDDQIPFYLPLLSMIVFVGASFIEGKLTMRSLKFRKALDGVPVVLMANGKLLQDHLKHVHLTVNDLLSEARVAGYFNLHEVAYAIMENSGKISFLPYIQHTPYTKEDAKCTGAPTTLYVSVVIDGELLKSELAAIGKDTNWFYQRCKELHYRSLQHILLAIADTQNNLFVYYKDETSPHKKHLL